MDSRVQDYLEDKLQAAADLDTLDTLLDNVKSQQQLLQRQLEDAKQNHEVTVAEAQRRGALLRSRAVDFMREQAEIDRGMLIVTQSKTSDEAVQRFERSMERLQKLDVAAGYIKLLTEVEALQRECAARLANSDDTALEPYRKLQHLATGMQPLQRAAEDAAPYLMDHLTHQANDLRESIRKSYADDLEKTLKKLQWPKPLQAIPLALEKEWAGNIGRVLELQRSELEDRPQSAEPAVLLPMEVLVHPLEQRFSFHFSGNKPTNRLDKPEFFLQHVVEVISTYSDTIQASMQPLLLQKFRDSNLVSTPAYMDATSALITALLPMVRRKISSVASQVGNQPQLLSHLVQEVINFDTTLRESYGYSPTSPTVEWPGLAHFLLDTCNYFNKWLANETQFALDRYQAIVNAPDAGQLDYDSVSADVSKPTKMAISVNDLLETVTYRYRFLSDFGQKMKFVVHVQVEIFDRLYERLGASLDAYITQTSSVGRAMQGITREEQAKLRGREGLDRLCRVFGSAEYLERAMRDWSDDVFFVELWDELQRRNANMPRANSLPEGEDGEVQGALFEETASHYRGLRARCEQVLVEMLTYNIREALKPYGRVTSWAALSSFSSGSVTAELVPLLDLLKEYFDFLSKALGRVPLRRVTRLVAHAIQNYIWDYVLTWHSFSTLGAKQLQIDVSGICKVIERYIGSEQARRGMWKLIEGVTLVSLPVGTSEDDNGDSSSEKAKMGLFDVERLVFMDNESARHALEQLGMETLTESEARTVLEKRVELSS
ncbi:hypothetical protein K470DRAFT_254507 [Piedraia hortae CBS 480.64]|uniref:RINT-1 family protein n=1 Tax=Piedraia hortae CBS 480.64 TaxID=1314780 RepID=A0A6A7CAF0_9PEZI|nr:hypothetical protein K470DRAFT_254507 [Piedraia hortae CBS 480.64]